MQDRQYLSETGGAGIISSLAMGLIDPINRIDVCPCRRRSACKVAATAGRFALANAVGGIASEAALSATRETRTLKRARLTLPLMLWLAEYSGLGRSCLPVPVSVPRYLKRFPVTYVAMILRRASARRRFSTQRWIRNSLQVLG